MFAKKNLGLQQEVNLLLTKTSFLWSKLYLRGGRWGEGGTRRHLILGGAHNIHKLPKELTAHK